MHSAAYAEEIDQLDLATAPRASVPAPRPQKRPVATRRPPSAKSDAGSILGAIMQAAANPEIDAEKVERLMGMYQKIRADEARRAYMLAFPAMQAELPTIDQNGRIVIEKNGQTIQSTPYAKWEDINEAIQPVLYRHGFGLFFRPGVATDGKITVTAVVSHQDGHQEEATITLTHDATGSKNSVQAVGSTLSYGQRYSARCLLNFQSRAKVDRDDDGEASDGAPNTITEHQAMQIREMAESVGANLPRFLTYMKITRLTDLPADRFGQAMDELKRKEKK